MEGYPVTIRLLDPPLHEFLPEPQPPYDDPVATRAKELAEVNPMMGHRGVRVGITYPQIYETQIRAVFEAASILKGRGIKAIPQIMIPQVGSIQELDHIKAIYDSVKSQYDTITVNFGTMIEVVRGALTANELAGTAEFFSFGTNDLTQATYSFSREDAEGKFLPEYMEKHILERNPFQTLDISGVGQLMKMGTSSGRTVRPDMEIGICGRAWRGPGLGTLLPRTGPELC